MAKSEPECLRGHVMEVLSVDIDDVCLVRELDEMLGTNFTVLVTKCGECLTMDEMSEATGHGPEEDV